MIWKFNNDEVIAHNAKHISWCGNVANEIKGFIEKNIREQGIGIDSHGLDFYNKCVYKALDSAEKTFNKMYKKELKRQVANIGI